MDTDDLEKYGKFGFRDDYVDDPNDCMSIYNARKDVLIFVDMLPLHQQIKVKRSHDSLTQEQLGKILRLSTSTICEIERGGRLIPKSRFKELDQWLYHSWYIDGELYDTIEY